MLHLLLRTAKRSYQRIAELLASVKWSESQHSSGPAVAGCIARSSETAPLRPCRGHVRRLRFSIVRRTRMCASNELVLPDPVAGIPLCASECSRRATLTATRRVLLSPGPSAAFHAERSPGDD